MGKYSEVCSYEHILGIVKDKFKNVLVIGCGGCMNESLAIKNGDLVFDKETNTAPAILNECIHLSNYLNNEGVKCSYYIINSGSNIGCIRNADGIKKTLGVTEDVEAILVMSCLDGVYGLKENMDEHHIPIYQISRWKGMFYYSYKKTDQHTRIVDGHVKYF